MLLSDLRSCTLASYATLISSAEFTSLPGFAFHPNFLQLYHEIDVETNEVFGSCVGIEQLLSLGSSRPPWRGIPGSWLSWNSWGAWQLQPEENIFTYFTLIWMRLTYFEHFLSWSESFSTTITSTCCLTWPVRPLYFFSSRTGQHATPAQLQQHYLRCPASSKPLAVLYLLETGWFPFEVDREILRTQSSIWGHTIPKWHDTDIDRFCKLGGACPSKCWGRPWTCQGRIPGVTGLKPKCICQTHPNSRTCSCLLQMNAHCLKFYWRSRVWFQLLSKINRTSWTQVISS